MTTETLPQEKHPTLNIVFNAIDHLSIVSAVLLSRHIEAHGKTKVITTEMGDVFSVASDQYLWVGCGVDILEKFGRYYENGAPGNKESLKVILKNSRVLDESVVKEETDGFTSVIMDAYYFLLETGVMTFQEADPEKPVDAQPVVKFSAAEGKILFWKYEKMAKAWDSKLLTSNGDKENSTIPSWEYEELEKTWGKKICANDLIANYSSVLSRFYQHVFSWTLLSEFDIFLLAELSEERIGEYKKSLLIFSEKFVSRFRFIEIVGSKYHYVTTVGPDVYSVLRRVGITGADFLHFRQGSYGSIIYSSLKVPTKSYVAAGSINLIPCPV